MAYTTIDDPSVYFQTALYAGDGSSSNAITNGGNSDLQPDWIWIKDRSATNGHGVQDTSRGIAKVLFTNGNDSEDQYTNTMVSSVQSDGFTVPNNSNSNTNTNNYVAWQWKANGGTTTTNDASSTGVGSIDSVYQANTTAGFSIVTYTGTGSTATVAHGLGAVPDMLIFKKRSAQDNWYVYHKQLTNDYYLVLDTTGAKNNDVNIWNDTDPTSTVFSIANAGVHADGKTMVCYAFAEKKGYSRFGMYRGNGAADGTFVFTGFKPSFLMFKALSGTENWGIFDNKRNTQTGNPRDIYLMPSATNADSAESDSVDFLSNGFKWRIDSGFRNGNGVDFIYMAFAESPFASSEGVPTTAG